MAMWNPWRGCKKCSDACLHCYIHKRDSKRNINTNEIVKTKDNECWKMIKERKDCIFLFLTKRIDRFTKCIPKDWNNGYDNVVVCCTIENQKIEELAINIKSKKLDLNKKSIFN